MPSPATSSPQIVFISSIDWGAAWQRHQIFASQFGAAGHEVFFVENSGFRNPRWSDLGRLRKKVLDLLSPGRSPEEPAAGVRVLAPKVLPPTGRLPRLFNRYLRLPALVERLKAAGLRPHPLVVVYFPTATSLDLLCLLEPSAVVYDCASNFRAHPDAPADFPEIEKALLSSSDVVVCDSNFLFEQKKAEHPRVVQIHQGVDADFLQARPGNDPVRSFCYYGTWGPDLAPEYLAALTEAGFPVTMSGFFKGDHAPLPPAVTRLEPTSPDKLRERLEGFDAFLMPYRITPFHLGVVPAKIYECLAMGRPILATPLPSLSPYKDLLYIAEDPAEWAAVARNLHKTETPELRRRRRELAAEHTHAKEFERFRTVVLGAAGAAGRDGPRPPAQTRLPRQVQAFVKGFSWIGLFYGAAKVSVLATQVVAGRVLGPAEFGKANLVLAVSAFLQILPTLGFPVALSKLLSPEKPEAECRAVTSTALATFLAWGALVMGGCLFLREGLSAALAVPTGLFMLALLYSFCNAFYVVVSSPLLGMQRFRDRGISEALYGFLTPAVLLALAARGDVTHRHLILALAASFAAAAVHSLWKVRSFLRPAFDPASFRPVVQYASVAALNLVTLACVLAPARLILNRHYTAHEVGVFSAYFTATAQISLSLLYMLTAVLIPVSSDPEGQAQAWSVFRRIRVPLTAAAWAGLTLAACAALFLFGKKYEFRLDWAVTLAAAASLIMTHGIAANILSARDFEGLKVSVAGSAVTAVGNIALCVVLIPAWGITGAAAALLGAYVLGLTYYALFGIKGTFRAP
ncbi:MAG: oligosaccharide flippase family protein [Elusimicrobia bacterium]|nr:oligosaccharide flippase family protein [Elusimicrobiota bacterium]